MNNGDHAKKHLGWRPLFRLRWLSYPLLPTKIAANKLRLPLLENLPFIDKGWQRLQALKLTSLPALRVQPITHADGSIDDLWEKIVDDYRFETVRDARWLNWRFLHSPLHQYQVLVARLDGKLLGYLAYRVQSNGKRKIGIIADIVTVLGDTTTVQQLLIATFNLFTDKKPLIRMYQIHTPLTAVLANIVSPLSSIQAETNRALSTYVTQKESIRKAQRLQDYLDEGLPIASGVIEGACRNVVKDRMEHSGMRWTMKGAHAMLALRSIELSGLWDKFMLFWRQQENQRLYSTTAANDEKFDHASVA